jgi:uncharacterized protein (TIGR03435 family)
MCISAAAVFSGAALSGQARPTFEVISIRPSADQQTGTGAVNIQVTNQQVRFAAMSLSDYVAMAYEVPRGRVNGPGWMETTRFDISATLPAGAAQAQMPAMFRSLLEDRFQIKAHKEKGEFPVYAIEQTSAGITLTKSADQTVPAADAPVKIAAGGSSRGVAFDLGGGTSFQLADNALVGTKLTMAQLADTLTNFVDRQVIDASNAPGNYDFKLAVTQEDFQGMLIRAAVKNGVVLPAQVIRLLDTSGIGSLHDALGSAGLALRERRAPLDIVVVDSLSREPTSN